MGVWGIPAALFPSFKLVNDIHSQIMAPDLLVYVSGISLDSHPGRQSMLEKKYKGYRILKIVEYYYSLKSFKIMEQKGKKIIYPSGSLFLCCNF